MGTSSERKARQEHDTKAASTADWYGTGRLESVRSHRINEATTRSDQTQTPHFYPKIISKSKKRFATSLSLW
jgi:hypothetical protein